MVLGKKHQTLVFQILVLRPVSIKAAVDAAADYVLQAVPHGTYEESISPLIGPDDIDPIRRLVLDEKYVYWVVPVKRFLDGPEPVKVNS